MVDYFVQRSKENINTYDYTVQQKKIWHTSPLLLLNVKIKLDDAVNGSLMLTKVHSQVNFDVFVSNSILTIYFSAQIKIFLAAAKKASSLKALS